MQAKLHERDEEILQLKTTIHEHSEELHFYNAAYEELRANYDQLLVALEEAKQDLALRDAVLAEYQQMHSEVWFTIIVDIAVSIAEI